MEINFSAANTNTGANNNEHGGTDANTLTSQEIFNYIRSQNGNATKSDDEIKAMMKNITINVDSSDGAVFFDLNDAVIGADNLGVIDFDRININDGNTDAANGTDVTDFTIFVADTNGLIINTDTVGFASTRNNLTHIASVTVNDSSAAGMTFANNALSVTLDNDVNWDSNSIYQADGQYHLEYNIDNNVNLSGAVAGFGNEINIAGDFSIYQSYNASGTRNDNGGDDVSANGVIKFDINVDSNVKANIDYDVNIDNNVDWSQAASGMLAAGTEVHVNQTGAAFTTTGDINVDTSSIIGLQITQEQAWGDQLLNWLKDSNGAIRNDAQMRWQKADNTVVTFTAAQILQIAEAMHKGDANVTVNGANITLSVLLTDIDQGNVGVLRSTTEVSLTDLQAWRSGTATGSWHSFTVTTNPAEHRGANSGGVYYLPPTVLNYINSQVGTDVATGTNYTSYSGAGAQIFNQTVLWPANADGTGPAANARPVKVLDLLAGGSIGTAAATTQTNLWQKINKQETDEHQLIFGDVYTTRTGGTPDNPGTGNPCRNCDPVAMIYFDSLGAVGSDASSLLASVSNTAVINSTMDYSQMSIHDKELSADVEFRTGVFVAANSTTNVSATINQNIDQKAEYGGDGARVIGEVVDNAGFREANYRSITSFGAQTYSGVNAATIATRENDKLRQWLARTENAAIDINNPATYNDALVDFFLSDTDEMSNDVFNNMTIAYLESNAQNGNKVTADKYSLLLSQKVTSNNDMFQVFMNLGISNGGANVAPKIVDLFNHMSSVKPTPTTRSTLEIAIDTLIEYAGTDAVASIYYQAEPAAEAAFNTAFNTYLRTNGARAGELANSLVKGLNNDPDNISRFAALICKVYPSDVAAGYIVNALQSEANWSQDVFAKISAALMNETTEAASDFKEINMLLSKMTRVDGTALFTSMKEQALAGDKKVQAYLRESVVSASRGIVNELDGALGQFQTAAIMEAAGQNLDEGGNLDIFGLNNSGQALLNVDSIILAAENLYKAAALENKSEIMDRLVNQILTGTIGFDLNAQSGNDAQYYNNIKRIAFISQGRDGTLLSAVGKCSQMSEYLGSNSNIMNSSTSAAINKLVGIKGFIGSTGSSYYVQFVDLSMSDIGVLANDGGEDSYAATYGNSYRALSVLGNDRSGIDIALDYTQDVSDWVFSNTHDLLGDDGTPRVVVSTPPATTPPATTPATTPPATTPATTPPATTPATTPPATTPVVP
jgi:hypothetical protein